MNHDRPVGARLATTVIVALRHDAAAPIVGDVTLRREDTRAELRWVIDPTDTDTGHGYAILEEEWSAELVRRR